MQGEVKFFKPTVSVTSPASVRLSNREMDIMKNEFQRLRDFEDIQDIGGVRRKVMNKAVQLIIAAKQDSKSGLTKDNYPAYALAALLRVARENDVFTQSWYLYNQDILDGNVDWIIAGKNEDKGWWLLFQRAEKYIGKGIQKSLVNFCESHQMTNPEFQKRYRIKEQIGTGAYATIHLAYDTKTKREISLKILSFKYPPGPEDRGDFNNEMKTMKKLSSGPDRCNPYLVCLNDWHCVTPPPEAKWGWKFVINMEYIRGTTLSKYKIKSDQEAKRIMLQIGQGLAYIHKNGIVHMDLHMANIMIDAEDNAKIIDFGISCSSRDRCNKWADELNIDVAAGFRPPEFGIPEFGKPKVDLTLNTYRASDVWMLGRIYQRILKERPSLTDQYQSLVAEMKTPDPSNRPSIEKVIQVLTGGLAKKIICANRKSLQGWEIQKYGPSDLIHYQENGQTYCFLRTDVSFLQQGINPFTGRKIRPDPLKEFIHLAEEKKLFDLYGVTLPKGITTKCPLFVSHDPLIGYHYHCEGLAKFVTRSISPGQDTDANCVGLMYQITLRRPLSRRDMDQFGFIRVTESNIVKDELIMNASSLEVARPLANRVLTESPNKTYPVYDSIDEETSHLSLRDSLREFMGSGGIIFPSQAIQDILVQKIKPSESIILYRGLTWNEWTKLTFGKWMDQIGRKKISIGDQLDITDTRVASWSANICISASFAVTGNYGLVLSYQAQPNEIMLDTRMMADREKFYGHDQAEVMLLPGRKDNGEWGDSITRQTRVEMVVWNTGQRTPSGFLLNKKPPNQYNLWVKELIIP